MRSDTFLATLGQEQGWQAGNLYCIHAQMAVFQSVEFNGLKLLQLHLALHNNKPTQNFSSAPSTSAYSEVPIIRRLGVGRWWWCWCWASRPGAYPCKRGLPQLDPRYCCDVIAVGRATL